MRRRKQLFTVITCTLLISLIFSIIGSIHNKNFWDFSIVNVLQILLTVLGLYGFYFAYKELFPIKVGFTLELNIKDAEVTYKNFIFRIRIINKGKSPKLISFYGIKKSFLFENDSDLFRIDTPAGEEEIKKIEGIIQNKRNLENYFKIENNSYVDFLINLEIFIKIFEINESIKSFKVGVAEPDGTLYQKRISMRMLKRKCKKVAELNGVRFEHSKE